MRLLTNDLYEGAWLLSQGILLEKVWHAGGSKKTVVFEFIGDRAIELLEDYRKGKALGNVVKFCKAQEEIKDRLFSFLRESQIQRLRKEDHHVSSQEAFQR